MLGNISGNGKGTGEDREAENRLGKDKFLEMFEGGLESGSPGPGAAFLGEVKEGTSNIGEVRDELPVEVGEAHKGADISEFFGGGPGENTIQLYSVHGEFVRMDDHSKVFHLEGSKLALLKFQV